MKATTLLLSSLLLLTSCDLLSPGDIENPNVSEGDFVKSDGAMTAWVNGANKQMANVMSDYVELTELLSDNYYNNYSMTSQVFDIPFIQYTDDDVTTLQRDIGTLRETALEGLTKVAANDKTTTDAQRFNLTYIEGFSFLLAGEYFTCLPMENGGEVKPWRDQLNAAVDDFRVALSLAQTDEERAFVSNLAARAYRDLGDKTSAVAMARQALGYSNDFVKQVEFDGANGQTNWAQFYLYEPKFQPLPRLDFLDPKYFRYSSATEERPICIAKAEECHLILAEAASSDGQLDEARQHLHDLLTLVKARPVQSGVNDQLETRGVGGYKLYPNSSDYRVAASADDSLRAGLVLDRQAPHLISVPYISGTSVTAAMIDRCTTADELLELTYLMRQEVFIAEARRAADLGIRLPVCETEANGNPSATGATDGTDYTKAYIPSYIPGDKGMDAFTMDTERKTVIIKYNMNRVLVEHKQEACPFLRK